MFQNIEEWTKQTEWVLDLRMYSQFYRTQLPCHLAAGVGLAWECSPPCLWEWLGTCPMTHVQPLEGGALLQSPFSTHRLRWSAMSFFSTVSGGLFHRPCCPKLPITAQFTCYCCLLQPPDCTGSVRFRYSGQTQLRCNTISALQIIIKMSRFLVSLLLLLICCLPQPA